MKKILLVWFLLLSQVAFSQIKIRNLFFNSTKNILRLNFSTQPPGIVYTNTGSGSTIGEGIAHSEDTDGNIILWVNASGVYDKTGTLMPGSSGILANPSSTEIVVCPFPNDKNKFYVFYNQQLCSALNYAVVDMTQRGGLGDIVSKNNPIDAPNTFAEGLEIIRIPCTNNFWLMTYQCYTGFKRFKIDASGISGGTIIQNLDANNHQGRGELDYYNGRIGYAVTYRNRAFVGDFNPVTGTISNGKDLTFAATNGMYGLEFSPDASKVYFTDWANRDFFGFINSANLFRYDFNTGVINSFNIDYDIKNCNGTEVEGLGQIELGKDGKLYIPHVNGCQISVIENPNDNALTFSRIDVNTILSTGVSDHIQSDFLDPLQLVADKPAVCAGQPVTLTVTGGTGGFAWQPLTGIANPGSRTVQVNPTATTTYTFLSDNKFGCRDSVSITIKVLETPSVELGNDLVICGNEVAKLDAGGSGKNYSYKWSDGSTGQTLETSQTGEYTVTASNGSCVASDKVKVTVLAAADLTLYNLITPDHDPQHLNETFEIKGYTGQINLVIYNRWGKEVFRKENYQNDWAAEGLPTGTYYYHLTHQNNCFKPVHGWVAVVR